jgi:DMSO reductase family type II enzyme heme b subunit
MNTIKKLIERRDTMKNKVLYRAMTFAVILGVMLLVIPMPADSAELVVAYVQGIDCLDPDDGGWALAQMTSYRMKHINYTQTGCGGGGAYEQFDINVKAVHDGTNICLRYEWPDLIEDDVINDVDVFADGVAIQIALDSGNTALQMGTQNNPVNIMFWRADLPQPQNIIAGGIGTIQPSPDAQNISHYQNWAGDQWTVIMSRPMAAASDNQVEFTRGNTYSVVHANWEGWDFERDGHKTISNWEKMDIE